MLNDSTRVIARYINTKDVDYAIILNGKWGCGKTYYILNNFEKDLGEENTNTNLYIVYLSLLEVADTTQLNFKVINRTRMAFKYKKSKKCLNIPYESLNTIMEDLPNFKYRDFF